MSRAVLSLGSNLGDRLDYLRFAVTRLGEAVVAVSGIYESKAWGLRDQPDFLNAVCIVDDPSKDHWAWLRLAQELEQAAGRVRRERFGPRTLDVDIVIVDDVRSDDPELVLPHPGTPARATVLLPWAEIDPTATLPGHGLVVDLLADIPDQARDEVWLRPDLAIR